jgi:hypothetical protein
MSDTWCEVKNVICNCKNGVCPNSKGSVAVVEEVVNIVNVVKERKVNRDPGNIKPRTKK